MTTANVSMWMALKQMIKRHEGLRLKPYRCTAGKLTIGYGRNLEGKGISEGEAEYLLEEDLQDAMQDAEKLVSNYNNLTLARQVVLANMCFQMGFARVKGFAKMLKAIEAEDFEEAAVQMMDSKWARSDTPKRAAELARIMLNGVM